MPTADRTEASDKVDLKEFLLAVINEREAKWSQLDAANTARFLGIDARFNRAEQSVKDALATANELLRAALESIDNRFASALEFRRAMEAKLNEFARKDVLDVVHDTAREAVVVAQAAAEKRLDSHNAFREQLRAQQDEFARKREVEIEVEALKAKIDAASANQQQSKGHWTGLVAAGGALVAVLTLVLLGIGVVVAVLNKGH